MTSLRSHPRIVDGARCRDGCTCGQDHPAPEVSLYYGEDGCRVMAEDVAAHFPGRTVAVISDPETDGVVGQELRRELGAGGIRVAHQQLPSAPHATDTLVAAVEEGCRKAALVISVGSGTINDLGKFSASRLHLPFWSMATAPSMNGYTSAIAAIQVKGVKRTLPAAPPQRIYALPSVICNAPTKLLQAGFCDVLAKVVSDIDWQCESILASGSYCSLPSTLMAEVESSYATCPEDIGRGEEKAVNGLFQGLLISGVAMSLAGSSAPASGGEHLLSHFLDMREPLTGRVPELHGLQVGMGILLSAACYRHLAALDRDALPRNGAEIHAGTAAGIGDLWGDFGAEVAAQFEGKKEILLSLDEQLPNNWERFQALFSRIRPAEYFADLFSRVGTPFTLQAFRLDEAEFRLAAVNCRAIRNRITVLDFAAHAGVLEQAVADTLALLR